jgi:hypothetical protein
MIAYPLPVEARVIFYFYSPEGVAFHRHRNERTINLDFGIRRKPLAQANET